MRISLALIGFLLSSCASVNHFRYGQPATLRGTLHEATCRTPKPYNGTLTVLELSQSIDVGPLRNVRRIELIPTELQLTQFGPMTGKVVIVSCTLDESGLCGYPAATCQPDRIKVEP
jgi:hypothetical protein